MITAITRWNIYQLQALCHRYKNKPLETNKSSCISCMNFKMNSRRIIASLSGDQANKITTSTDNYLQSEHPAHFYDWSYERLNGQNVSKTVQSKKYFSQGIIISNDTSLIFIVLSYALQISDSNKYVKINAFNHKDIKEINSPALLGHQRN